jgi:NitT/TauT family transport system permease protein
MRRYLVATLFFLALLAAWQGMVMSGRWSPVLLPSPAAVGEYLWAALWNW